jgi:hypothetical protein
MFLTAHSTNGDGSTNQSDPGAGDESFAILGRLRLTRTLTARGHAPVLAADALTGLSVEVVDALAPITEASPAAMLATLLATYGTMCGPHAHVLVGSKPHYPNIFVLVVGATAKARKGTSAAAVRPILDAADNAVPPFFPGRRLLGIQSGEALIQAAAEAGTVPLIDASDPFASLTAPKPDQRLLVEEEEYARLLEVAGRQGSILSSTLRSAWDGGQLANKTRKESLVAPHAHIGIVAHVTLDELLLKLNVKDVSNGYANRFLHVWSARAALHPEPGRLPDATIRPLGARLSRAVAFARSTGEISRSREFSDAWDSLYRVIESQPSGGLAYDSLTARATAHVLRLCLLYALLDMSPVLHVRHLEAAVAFWDYCEATVAHIWGATLGDARLDKLATALVDAGPPGLDRTQINGLFSNNLSKDTVDGLIHRMLELGLARQAKQPTGGRPREVLVTTTS